MRAAADADAQDTRTLAARHADEVRTATQHEVNQLLEAARQQAADLAVAARTEAASAAAADRLDGAHVLAEARTAADALLREAAEQTSRAAAEAARLQAWDADLQRQHALVTGSLQAQVAAATEARHAAELEARRAMADRLAQAQLREDQWRERERDFAATQATAAAELQQQRAKLEQQRADATREYESLVATLTATHRQRQAEQDAALAAESKRLEASTAASLAADTKRLEVRIAERQRALDAQAATLGRERDELDAQHSRLTAETERYEQQRLADLEAARLVGEEHAATGETLQARHDALLLRVSAHETDVARHAAALVEQKRVAEQEAKKATAEATLRIQVYCGWWWRWFLASCHAMCGHFHRR